MLAGLTTVEALQEAPAGRLEALAKRQPPFGAELHRAVGVLPKFQLTVVATDDLSRVRCRVEVNLRLCNALDCKIFSGDTIVVLAKDARGALLFSRKHS